MTKWPGSAGETKLERDEWSGRRVREGSRRKVQLSCPASWAKQAQTGGRWSTLNHEDHQPAKLFVKEAKDSRAKGFSLSGNSKAVQ